MRYAVISDIHANLKALRDGFGEISERRIDRVVCLGDVVGYNDEPNECCDFLRKRDVPTVCGNHDAVACGKADPWGMHPKVLESIERTRESLSEENKAWLSELPEEIVSDGLLFVHGAPGNYNTYLFTREDAETYVDDVASKGCQVCFLGHTHQPAIFCESGATHPCEATPFTVGGDGWYFINVGSVGQPRVGDQHGSFGVFDTESNEYRLVRLT